MKRRPKILRIINRFNLGGPTYNAAYLTKYLEDDFDTLLIGGQKQESEASSLHITDSLGIKPRIIQSMSREIGLKADYLAYREISSIIREYKPDIVHSHASKAGLLGRLAAKRNGVPHMVHTFHGHVFEHYFSPLKTKAIIQLERYLAGFSEKIIAISEKQKNDLVDRFHICPEEKIQVIPLGFDLERFQTGMDDKRRGFREQYGLSEDETAIGIIGRLVPIKNHQLFLESLSMIKESGASFRAFIIGDGELKLDLERKALELNLTTQGEKPDLTFTSWILDVDRAMAGLDIIAMTSLNEGTPVSLIEAQAAGKAVISTDVGGVRDVVIDRESGFLVESGNVQDLTRKLVGLLNDQDLRLRMGSNGKTLAMARFSSERLASDVKKLYRKLLD